MCSKTILKLAVLVVIVNVVKSIHVYNDEFINKIERSCYWRADVLSKPIPLLITHPNSVHSQGHLFKYGPPSMSVETLIALIEKIEAKIPDLKTKQLVLALLRQFRTDDLTYSNGFYEIPANMKIQYKIESAVFNQRNDKIETSFLNNVLSQEDNCTLHYLLSHNIDIVEVFPDKLNGDTFKQISNESTTESTIDGHNVEYKPRFSIVSLPNGTQLTKKPREYGVGTFRQNRQQAILLNKLLLGIAAGLSNPIKVSVEELYSRVGREFNMSDVKLNIKSEVDPLMAITLAGVLSYGAFTDIQVTENLFGSKGMWNSTLCSTEYDLAVDTKINSVNDIAGVAATMAEIRGAIDGYNIGQALREMTRLKPESASKDLKLSQILRFYYSPTGFEPETTAFGYCQRNKTNFDEMEVISEAQSLKRLSILLSKGAVQVEDSYATAPIEKVKFQFLKTLKEAKQVAVEDRHWCTESDRHSETVQAATCESKTDVFILLDPNHPEDKVELQYSIIDSIAKELNIHRFGDSLTVVAMAQNRSVPQKFHRIVWNATNKGCATCRVEYADLRNLKDIGKYENYPKMIETLLDEVKTVTSSQSAVASRIFITMKFGSKQRVTNHKVIADEFKKLRTKYREVQFLMIGDLVKGEVYENDYFSADTQSVQLISQRIVRRICESPSTFQYPECNSKPSNEIKYESYITPGGVQNWAIFPEFFHSSNQISFKFQSQFGKLVVCVGRSPNEHLEHKAGVCFETTEFTSSQSQPCKGATRETCRPFYFTVYGKSDSEQPYVCTDERCLNMKQIPFTFTHTGLTCNNSVLATASPILIGLSLLFTLVKRSFL